MKKIVSGIFIFLFLSVLQNSCSASEVSFIYINGSNNNNEKMKNWFEKGVNKLHPVLKKRFEENEQIKQLMLSSEGLNIAENPEIFFWGDLSKTDLDFVHQQLDISKNFSPTVAYQVSSLITQYMHDAIWVQKSHHMQPIVQNLNEKIKKEQEAGRSVILYGYSAGTFITYEYLFNTLTYINLSELFNAIKVSDEVREFVKNNPRKDTCIAALAEGKIGVVSSGGKLIFDNNDESLKKHYLEMDIATEKVCSPKGAVRGVVNFASPLVLFYSDLADSDYELTYYNKLMLKYIMENGLFMLTVNFREDPLGFPTSKNLTYEEMEELLKFQFANPSGFVFDNSSAWSWRPFFLAHTSYWSAKKQFSKAVVNSIVEGYRYQYDKTYRAKMQKKSKKYELL